MFYAFSGLVQKCALLELRDLLAGKYLNNFKQKSENNFPRGDWTLLFSFSYLFLHSANLQECLASLGNLRSSLILCFKKVKP